jgi:hypothetical protein
MRKGGEEAARRKADNAFGGGRQRLGYGCESPDHEVVLKSGPIGRRER